MGTIPNIGLMAQKAEEYGSHPQTFVAACKWYHARRRRCRSHAARTQPSKSGDIWRMCMVKDGPIRDWVKLAVNRARLTNTPAVFWLNEARAHDRELISKVQTYLKDHDTGGLEIHIQVAQGRDPVLARAHEKGPGHDLRQRAMCCAIT